MRHDFARQLCKAFIACQHFLCFVLLSHQFDASVWIFFLNSLYLLCMFMVATLSQATLFVLILTKQSMHDAFPRTIDNSVKNFQTSDFLFDIQVFLFKVVVV